MTLESFSQYVVDTLRQRIDARKSDDLIEHLWCTPEFYQDLVMLQITTWAMPLSVEDKMDHLLKLLREDYPSISRENVNDGFFHSRGVFRDEILILKDIRQLREKEHPIPELQKRVEHLFATNAQELKDELERLTYEGPTYAEDTE